MADSDNIEQRCFPASMFTPDEMKALVIDCPKSCTPIERELQHNRAKIRRMRKEINNLSASHERMKAGYVQSDARRKSLDMMLDQERQLVRLYQQMASDYRVELDRVRNKLKEMEERYGKR